MGPLKSSNSNEKNAWNGSLVGSDGSSIRIKRIAVPKEKISYISSILNNLIGVFPAKQHTRNYFK